MRLKQLVIIIILSVVLVSIVYNQNKEATFYMFFEEVLNVEVVDSENQTIFKDRVIGTDLFVPAYFRCRDNYPLKLVISNQEANMEKHFLLKKSFGKYSILEINIDSSEINMVRNNRITKPVFQ